jgi:RNA polymerase sigma factor (sigma-70 family)
MVKSLDGLNKVESFWPWMYRIAQSKIQQHFKNKQKMSLVSDPTFYQDFASYRSDSHVDEGLRQLVNKDLSKKVIAAMKHIKQQYRAVLSLRCFEDLSYSDIAVAMQCSEVKARVLFYRAKQALKKELGHQGLSKSLLLTSLGLFGRLTAPAEGGTSAIAVTASTTQVGLTAAALATASSKPGITVLSVLTAVLAGVGGMSLRLKEPLPESHITSKADVKSVHFTSQLMDNSPEARGSLSKGAYEQWLYFPDGADGPMFMRMQRWDPQQRNKLCAWLENEQANYYFDSGTNIVHITNCRVCWSNLKVRRLPTDSEQFIEFLSDVENNKVIGRYQRDPNTTLLTSFVDYRFDNAPDFKTEYLYNTAKPELFVYDWPAEIPIVDDRDPMHKRGWTYFSIYGIIGEQKIDGQGCIPFFYKAAKEHPAWLTLKIGNDLKIADYSGGAYLKQGDRIIAEYEPGTFFKGLARPWMGMHAANIVRRDAAEQRIWFHSEWAPNEKDVIVDISDEEQQNKTDLIYTIDMENDIIKTITFDVNGQAAGSLIFSYIQDIDRLSGEFTEPVIPAGSKPLAQNQGIKWLISLAQGNLGK